MLFYQLMLCKTNHGIIKPSISDGKFNGLPDRGIGNSQKSLRCGVMTSFVAANDDFCAFSADVKFKVYIGKVEVWIWSTHPIKPILGLKCSSRKCRIGL